MKSALYKMEVFACLNRKFFSFVYDYTLSLKCKYNHISGSCVLRKLCSHIKCLNNKFHMFIINEKLIYNSSFLVINHIS